MDNRTNSDANIILTGFMGAGKTSVGREVARRMGRPFIDMDTVLVERLGAPIADVFAQRGEAVFRAAESALCQELSTPTCAVIAAGGGTVVSMDNRLALGRGGLLICLTCAPQQYLRRIGNPQSRPMLRGGDPAARIAEMAEQRRPIYASIPRQIDTTHLSITEVAAQAIALYERDSDGQTQTVRHDAGSYDIMYGDGILGSIGQIVAERGLSGQIAVITNTTVGPIWSDRVAHSLEEAGLRPLILQIADGEQAKTLHTVSHLYDCLAVAGLERSEAVLALGGGVVGDIAGFVAATYLRGVPFVQAPTTVLAMVDSSVGGKVGVDHARGKNLIGAFKQPQVVVADFATLLSLPAAERISGLAEAIKHGLIAAPDILDRVESDSVLDLAWLIPRSVRVKIDVVQEDPYERGRRAELNLGHTFGHALENLSGYRLRHGEAVSIGMVAACRVAARLGLCAPELAERMEGILRKVELPVRHAGYEAEAIWAAMASDKKRKGGKLRFILPVRPGQMLITDQVPQSLVVEVMRELAQSSRLRTTEESNNAESSRSSWAESKPAGQA